jgi:hypothetical protein
MQLTDYFAEVIINNIKIHVLYMTCQKLNRKYFFNFVKTTNKVKSRFSTVSCHAAMMTLRHISTAFMKQNSK